MHHLSIPITRYRNHSSWFDSSFDPVRTKQQQKRVNIFEYTTKYSWLLGRMFPDCTEIIWVCSTAVSITSERSRNSSSSSSSTWRSTLDCFQIVLSSVLSEFVILILVLLGSLTCSSISIVIPYIYHFVSILQKFNKIRQHRNQHACLRRWTRWRSMHKLCVFANEQQSASTSRLDFYDKASSRAHA